MKQRFLYHLTTAAMIALTVIIAGSCNRPEQAGKELVLFYDVPLVCGAAPDIGCGSRSKPALLEMEKHPAIKEAWLNRAGTVLAIVWRDHAQTDDVVKPILDHNEISFSVIGDSAAAKYIQTFRKQNEWYRGANVDELSIEEAGRIAGNYVTLALEKRLLSMEEAEQLKVDVEEYFKKELVKIRTNQELIEDSMNKFHEAMISIGEKHIGKERTTKVINAYIKYQEECNTEETSGDDSKSACCKKK